MLNNHNSGLMLPPLKQIMEVTKCSPIKFCYVIRTMNAGICPLTIAGHSFQNECPSLHLGSLRKPAYIINYFICLFFYNSSIRLRTKTRQIAIKPLYSSNK